MESSEYEGVVPLIQLRKLVKLGRKPDRQTTKDESKKARELAAKRITEYKVCVSMHNE
jgi:hypothetical protein